MVILVKAYQSRMLVCFFRPERMFIICCQLMSSILVGRQTLIVKLKYGEDKNGRYI